MIVRECHLELRLRSSRFGKPKPWICFPQSINLFRKATAMCAFSSGYLSRKWDQSCWWNEVLFFLSRLFAGFDEIGFLYSCCLHTRSLPSWVMFRSEGSTTGMARGTGTGLMGCAAPKERKKVNLIIKINARNHGWLNVEKL